MITVREIKEELHGCEILSLTYGGCVGVTDGVAVMCGERIEKPNWRALWAEYVEGELGPDPFRYTCEEVKE